MDLSLASIEDIVTELRKRKAVFLLLAQESTNSKEGPPYIYEQSGDPFTVLGMVEHARDVAKVTLFGGYGDVGDE